MNTEERGDNIKTITETELVLYFQSELNPIEHARIEAWISESVENKNLAENTYMATLASDIHQTINSIPTDDALKKVNSKIRKRKINIGVKWAQRVAAILFIPLLMLTSYLLLNTRTGETEFISFKTNPGIIADFKLPDGTKVWLNAHSSLTYPSKFTGDIREVKLSGEAYFDVEADKEHPFIVTVDDNVHIEATGTEFNVDAYTNNKFITATLATGSINVSYLDKISGLKTQTIIPGEKIIIKKENKSIKLIKTSTLVETGWKDGKIYLENTPIEDMLHTLSKRFNADFILINEKLKDNHFTGIFSSQDLNLILKHLEVSSNISHKIEINKKPDGEEKMTIKLY